MVSWFGETLVVVIFVSLSDCLIVERLMSFYVKRCYSELNFDLDKGPSIKYVRPKVAIFEPPTHPCTKKYASALPPTPPLYKRILVTHFQNTMYVIKSKNMNRTNL